MTKILENGCASVGTSVSTSDTRNITEFQLALEQADTFLSKSYLNAFGTARVVPLDESKNGKADVETLNQTIRFYDVSQIVLDASENARDKLVSVFNAVGSVGAGLLTLIRGTKGKVSIHLGVKSPNGVATGMCGLVLQHALEGNFPGTLVSPVRKDGFDAMMRDTFARESCTLVSVTDVAGMRSEQESKDRMFMQGIEKVVDAMRGREYSLLLVSDPVSPADMATSRRALENLYSCLVPYSESQLTMGASESETVGRSIAHTVTKSITHSVGTAVSHTTGHSVSHSESTGKSRNLNPGIIGSVVGAAIGAVTPIPGGAMIGASVGGTVAGMFSFGKSKGTTVGTSDNFSDTETKNTNVANGLADANTEGQSDSRMSGTNRSLMLKSENHAIKCLLKKIDKTLERYNVCADVGMWNSAAYILAPNPTDAEVAASVYHSVVRGKNSSLETGRVAVWNEDTTPGAIEYIRRLMHPLVDIAGMPITPGTLVSSSELAIAAGLPNRSLPGLPVLECARFGRTVSSYGESNSITGSTNVLNIGRIWNMNREEDLSVNLDPDSLSAHTFVTGSTGSGKSNTIYRMLSGLRHLGSTFLVVEPAKGEYRSVLGCAEGVTVYGTNPLRDRILRINPFSFPNGVHIYEHLDRLVDIFNVCWPMYAAMPAVLKEAIENAYRECGWDMTNSTNAYGNGLYPTFADVSRCVREVIDSSEYDAENKGAYKGSLLTRLTSLTNGINSLVFRADEVPDAELFDVNAIVDLSRVGSSETKSLIMGVLVLKLQEYRMTSGRMNSSLRHVTVLEEAHNLLRRSSASSTAGDFGGGASLQAKSVEMLANAIAEMRTYGEGFIIADQAPGLLDMSVIRNTNTKIVMRLPDQGDRELVGRAMHLTEVQVSELARLPRGVAAVYQNEWVESVLCKVEKHEVGDCPLSHDVASKILDTSKNSVRGADCCDAIKASIMEYVLAGVPLPSPISKDLKDGKISLSARSRVIIAKMSKGEINPPKFTVTGFVVSELYPNAVIALRNSIERTSDKEKWTHELVEALPDGIGHELRRDIVQAIMTEVLLHELNNRKDFNAWYEGGFLR